MALQAISTTLLQRALPPSTLLLSGRRRWSGSGPRANRSRPSATRSMATGKEVITTDGKALGPYSQAVRAGNTLYVSGQIGLKPGTKDLADGIEEQAHAVLKQLGAILEAGGTSYANVVRTTVLLTDMGNFQTVNAVYAQYFDASPPARMAYGVAALPFGAMVEIDAVAIVP